MACDWSELDLSKTVHPLGMEEGPKSSRSSEELGWELGKQELGRATEQVEPGGSGIEKPVIAQRAARPGMGGCGQGWRVGGVTDELS